MPFSHWEVSGINGWVVFASTLFILFAALSLLYYFLMRRALAKYFKQFHGPGKGRDRSASKGSGCALDPPRTIWAVGIPEEEIGQNLGPSKQRAQES